MSSQTFVIEESRKVIEESHVAEGSPGGLQPARRSEPIHARRGWSSSHPDRGVNTVPSNSTGKTVVLADPGRLRGQIDS